MTTNKLFARAAVAAVLVLTGLPVKAQTHGGSRAPLPSPAELAQRLAAAQANFPSVLANALSAESIKATMLLIQQHPILDAQGLTNFDNVNAPCDFNQTSPLIGPEQFAGFEAPAPDGGGILNVCSNFGVAAHSPPNFLAFNDITGNYGGGTPKTPELIYVAKSSTSVSLWVSGGANPSYPYAIVAYSQDGGVLAVVNANTSEAWTQQTISASGIVAIGLVGNPGYLLIDDIQSE
jgi:hypothetical protein